MVGGYCVKISRKQDLKRLGFGFFAVSFFLFMGVLYTYFGIGKQAILIDASGFYQEPAYAAAYQSEIFAPGSVLDIKEESDIWYKIAVNGREFWIPKFKARVL